MGLADWFRTFCGNIQVQNGAAISLRNKAITKRLNTDFWDTDSDTAHSLYVGSYGRNTAIHGQSDVDVIFRLPYSVYKQYDDYSGNGQSALLQAVRTSVKKTYVGTNIGADGQVILIPFNDGITFETGPRIRQRQRQLHLSQFQWRRKLEDNESEAGDRGDSRAQQHVQQQPRPALPDDAILEEKVERSAWRPAHRHPGIPIHHRLGVPRQVVPPLRLYVP